MNMYQYKRSFPQITKSLWQCCSLFPGSTLLVWCHHQMSSAMSRSYVWCDTTYKHIKVWHTIVGPILQQVCPLCFALPLHQTPRGSPRLFCLKCWACLFSEIVIAVISHSVPWQLFSSTVDSILIISAVGGPLSWRRFLFSFFPPSVVVSLCCDNPLPSQQQ